MEDIYYQWIITIVALLVVVVSRIGIPIFMRSWRGKIKSFVKERKNPESLEQINLIEVREEKLSSITKTVAIIELLVFSGLTLLLFNEEPSTMGKVKIFGAFFGGWLTLKILSNHKPWSDEIAGKAHYHTSLIGTLLNVLTGFIVGWLIYVAWFLS